MKNFFLLLGLTVLFSCTNSNSSTKNTSKASTDSTSKTDSSKATENRVAADAATIMARPQVPILCYHHIRDIQMPGRSDRGYEVTVAQFKAQMKALADSGYHTVLPNQLYDYLVYGTPL